MKANQNLSQSTPALRRRPRSTDAIRRDLGLRTYHPVRYIQHAELTAHGYRRLSQLSNIARARLSKVENVQNSSVKGCCLFYYIAALDDMSVDVNYDETTALQILDKLGIILESMTAYSDSTDSHFDSLEIMHITLDVFHSLLYSTNLIHGEGYSDCALQDDFRYFGSLYANASDFFSVSLDEFFEYLVSCRENLYPFCDAIGKEIGSLQACDKMMTWFHDVVGSFDSLHSLRRWNVSDRNPASKGQIPVSGLRRGGYPDADTTGFYSWVPTI